MTVQGKKTDAGFQATVLMDRQDDCAILRVYDIYGRLIFTTNNCSIQEQDIPYSGIVIFRFSSKNNTTLKAQKRCLIHGNNLK